jgi:hypothetical protein
MREWRNSSIILDLGTKQRSVASFMHRPPYALHNRLGGPHIRSGHSRKKSLTPAWNGTPTIQSCRAKGTTGEMFRRLQLHFPKATILNLTAC